MSHSRILLMPRFAVPWLGQLVSGVGDAAWLVVFALMLSQHGVSATGFGLAALSIGSVFSLGLAGLIVDRFSDRDVVVVCDVVRISASFLALFATADGGPAVLYVSGLLYGAGQGLYRPSYTALIMELAPREALRQANRLRSLGNRVAAFMGAALGGLLFGQLGARISIAVNVASYLISIATLPRAQASRRSASGEDMAHEARSLLGEATAGLRTVLATPWQSAWVAQGMVQVGVVTSVWTVSSTLLLKDQGGAYGYVVGAAAVGAFMGSLTAPEIADRMRGTACVVLALVQGLELAVLYTGVHWIGIALAAFASGYAMSWFSLYWMTALQENTDRAVLGRVLSVDSLATQLLAPIGLAVAGAAVGAFGVRATIVTAGLILILSLIPIFLLKGAISLGYTR